MPPSSSPASGVGVDVGGTFTDLVWMDGSTIHVRKVPTTRPQHHAVADGLGAMNVPAHASIAHGTTTATNAILERRGAKTALLTTRGFADVLAIGRQHRPDLYALRPSRPEPLVPASLRLEVSERLDADGAVVTPLDEDEVHSVAQTLAASGVESVAVVFLFSYQNPAHERRTVEILREVLPGVPVTASHRLLPEMREYERTATTVLNAYVRPGVAGYLDALDDTVGARSVRVMQSNGGTIGLEQAAREAARLALSGPAGGVVGALALARRSLDTDAPRILTLDMGGTSTDVALCNGAIPRTAEHTIGDLPLRLPSTDIHTVGAGGGSIATVDAGGSLRVGPESAGAEPGPACYGRGGTQATVTDAHLVLGRLHPDHLLGGDDTLNVDPDAAREALRPLANATGRSVEAAAVGVLQVANAAMERALRRVSVQRGHDPRGDVLVPFGGAGPLHAAALADALGMRQVLVPPTPGVLSALGLLMADVVYDTVRSVLSKTDALAGDVQPLRSAVDAGLEEVRAALDGDRTPQIDVEADVRYVGQSYELTVPLPRRVAEGSVPRLQERFHEAHRRRFGHASPEAPVEVVSVRVRGAITSDAPDLPTLPEADALVDNAVLHTREVWFDAEGPVEAVAYDRARLQRGHGFDGPAIIHQYDTTVVLPPGWTARIDAVGALLATRS